MITRLYIKNYALIDELDLELSNGFAVITGETGAGKSILLGALGLLLGGRADARAVKSGQQKCVVEAEFDVKGLSLEHIFEELDVDFDANSCVIRRELTAAGKSRAFVNDTPVVLTDLRVLTESLVDVHSQHQNLLIRDENFLLNTLDLVGGDKSILAKYQEDFIAHQQVVRELHALRERLAEDTKEQEYMQFQFDQLSTLQLHEGEQAELEQEQKELAHAEDIQRGYAEAFAALQGAEISVSEQVRHAQQSVDGISAVHQDAEELAERLHSLRLELDDVCATLEQQADRVEANPQRLQQIDDRLSAIYDLQRKHQVATVEELIAIQASLDERLNNLESGADDLVALEKREMVLRKALEKSGGLLTEKRRDSSAKLTGFLTEMLRPLGMPSVTLSVEFAERPAPSFMGMDNVTLLFSANKAVPAQDIARIASGGEIARLMLCLKAIIASQRQLPTIIFDEVDTGVSGEMAARMGELMARMGQHSQVLAITHLPQIAAQGTQHFLVYNNEDAEGTHSHIRPPTTEERITEIAHILSGATLTDAAIQNAKSLLNL